VCLKTQAVSLKARFDPQTSPPPSRNRVK